MIIYLATHVVSGKRYVGLTIKETFGPRLNHHFCAGSGYFDKALRKHGREAFKFEVIDRAQTRKELSQREQYWIAKLDTMAPNGYNLTTGGEGAFKRHPSTKRKMSKSQKESWTPERREEARKSRGPIPSDVSKKISESLKTYFKRHPETAEAISKRNIGREVSTETRKKISESNLGKNAGRPRPDFVINAQKWLASKDYINPMTGRSRPDLAKTNASESHRKAVSLAAQKRRERGEKNRNWSHLEGGSHSKEARRERQRARRERRRLENPDQRSKDREARKLRRQKRKQKELQAA